MAYELTDSYKQTVFTIHLFCIHLSHSVSVR